MQVLVGQRGGTVEFCTRQVPDSNEFAKIDFYEWGANEWGDFKLHPIRFHLIFSADVNDFRNNEAAIHAIYRLGTFADSLPPRQHGMSLLLDTVFADGNTIDLIEVNDLNEAVFEKLPQKVLLTDPFKKEHHLTNDHIYFKMRPIE